ncbi:MAG: aromatic ring-hydroxylating dioxygenase subunit alpha [Alphaproteobacteria bacterium]|nr:aromatic ring-hydroxylating dioxygenase subunit alpha [Alphaproteobacteria bacterium]
MSIQDVKSPMFLRNLWYFALHTRALKPGKLIHKTILGEPIVFGRTREGEAFALRDLCPHRGVPLSAGRIVEGTIECPYHGWRFKPSGQCSLIPSLVGEEGVEASKIGVRKYSISEKNGLIWVYIAEDAQTESRPATAPPHLPITPQAMPTLIEAQLFPCGIDHAVVGLMDPAHGPFVHRAWWWRSAASIHAKAKKYAPSHLGFTMVTHKPSSNSTLYKLLGGDRTTEISFQLPSIRVEHIKAGRNEVVGLTTCTPLNDDETEVTQTFYWNMAWIAPFKPIAQSIARVFLGQDRHMVTLQKEGLKFNPRLMLIQDADVPAMWYYRLKKEWHESSAAKRDFVNPVPEATLRWRS